MDEKKMQEYLRGVQPFLQSMCVYDDTEPDDENDKLVRDAYEKAKESICSFFEIIQEELLPDISYAFLDFPGQTAMIMCGRSFPVDVVEKITEIVGGVEYPRAISDNVMARLNDLEGNPWEVFVKHMNMCAHGIMSMLAMKGVSVEPEDVDHRLLREYGIQDIIGLADSLNSFL